MEDVANEGKKVINIWAPVEFCVFFYEKVYNLIERILREKYVDKVSVKVWTLICSIILFVLYAFLDNMIYTLQYNRYVIVTVLAVYLICIVMIAARNVPDKLRQDDDKYSAKSDYEFIHNKLLWIFIVMSFGMMISEFFVNQERGFIGQFNILVIGFLAYVIYRTRNEKILFDGIIWSVFVAFGMLAVKTLFFETNVYWEADGSLLGPYNNPNLFATVLLPALAVGAMLIDYILTKKIKR